MILFALRKARVMVNTQVTMIDDHNCVFSLTALYWRDKTREDLSLTWMAPYDLKGIVTFRYVKYYTCMSYISQLLSYSRLVDRAVPN